MKILVSSRYCMLAGLFFLAGLIFISCNKNDDTDSSKVQLLSFGPTGVEHGDSISIMGTNLDKVTSIDFPVGVSVPKESFVSQAAGKILVTVPDDATEGHLVLKMGNDSIISLTRINFNVPIKILSFPQKVKPGTKLAITGKFLNWVESIEFTDKVVVPKTSFTSQSIDKIELIVPFEVKSGDITISSGGSEPMIIDTTLEVTLPLATSFSPNPVKHQTNVTINGTDLDLVKEIKFSGVTTTVTNFVSQSATQIVVNVPSATTKGKVTLYPASGVPSVSADDLDVTLPAITTMLPGSIDIGANLTITGSNLDIVNSISFQGVSTAVTSFVSQSPIEIQVKVPTGTINGKITLGVLNSTLVVLSSSALIINGYVPPGGPAFPIYDDAITNNWTGSGGWTGGGWGGSKDLSNSTPVKAGNFSCKITYTSGGWGVPLQLGGAGINLAPYTAFRISIYGAPGSGGKSVNVGFNENDGKTITVVEGKWTDYSIPVGQISSATTLTHLYIKNYTDGGTNPGDFTIYIDEMGLD